MPEQLFVSAEEIFRASAKGEKDKLHRWGTAYESDGLKIHGYESGAERDRAIDELYGGFGIGPIRPGDTFILGFRYLS